VKSIDEMLLIQRGRDLGLKFSDESLKNGLENLKTDYKLDDAGLADEMRKSGITMDQLRQNFERAFLREQTINEEIFRRMHVTEEELRGYYGAHKDQFTTPETVTLRELYISAPTGPNSQVRPDDNAAARVKIEALRARAVAGEDFEQLVRTQSDAPSKTTGGVVGPVNLDDISPTVRDAIASLKAGDISQPLAMPRGGYEIFKMDARSIPTVLPFDKVKPQIEQKVRESRLDSELAKLLNRLRSEAVIEWKDDSYKKLYQQGLGVVTTASNENR
jgi:peptidyl-prolyl cis-trans isomerase SurA